MITLGQLLATLNGATRVNVFTLGSQSEPICKGTSGKLYFHLYDNDKETKNRLVHDISIVNNEVMVYLI